MPDQRHNVCCCGIRLRGHDRDGRGQGARTRRRRGGLCSPAATPQVSTARRRFSAGRRSFMIRTISPIEESNVTESHECR